MVGGAMISLKEVNAMNAHEFVAAFGDIAEHSSWVAERTVRPFSSRVEMIDRFGQVVHTATLAQQLSLLQAHPDLATRAKLTADSTHEQKGAGLDRLNAEELAKITALNNQYKEQNGFPFIFAVNGATKHQILESFKQRIHNTRDDEFQVALQQVCKIIGFRLEARVSE
jgi:2-oxo-4-hydroxy-4-carboxy-5-ureidoimidazoline decarboxylase